MDNQPDHSSLPLLQVHASKRYLIQSNGRPFFWLADTAWELFHRLDLAETEVYLQDRANKKFSVIQSVLLAELDGLHTPNPAGHLPLIDDDPARPNPAYFADVDKIIERAEQLGLYFGLLPTWGDKWHKSGGIGPLVFNEENARRFGRFLGQRYRHSALVWILGGDKFVGDEEEHRILEAMAEGLREGDEGRHLITFHPIGQYSSAHSFPEAPWLDFHMIQSGHTLNRDNYNSILADYCRTPPKPVLDAEPGYENSPHAFNSANPRLEALHVRRFCYWALFSGAFGHTYGCNEIWQMWQPNRQPVNAAYLPWREALQLPGACQMQHARTLIESGPYFDRLPDPSLVEPPNTTGPDYTAACRAPDGRYALIYFPSGREVNLRTYLLRGPRLTANWYDPRHGELRPLACEITIAPWRTTAFLPPSADDWVLVLNCCS